jgi:hypothetical protein
MLKFVRSPSKFRADSDNIDARHKILKVGPMIKKKQKNKKE